jgi:hypothetical protein
MSLYRSPSVEDLLLILGPQGHDSKDPRGFHLYQTKSAFYKTASFQIQLKNCLSSGLITYRQSKVLKNGNISYKCMQNHARR